MQPFGMLQNVLAWRLQIADDDDTETVRRKIVEGIAPLFDEDGLAAGPPAGAARGRRLLGQPACARHRRRRAPDPQPRLPRRGAGAAPHRAAQTARRSLLLLDDLHWADDGSLDFISYLAQVNRDVPMLLLCLTRPTLFERRPDWALLYGTHQRIELQAAGQARQPRTRGRAAAAAGQGARGAARTAHRRRRRQPVLHGRTGAHAGGQRRHRHRRRALAAGGRQAARPPRCRRR